MESEETDLTRSYADCTSLLDLHQFAKAKVDLIERDIWGLRDIEEEKEEESFVSSEISQTLSDFMESPNRLNKFCTNLKANIILTPYITPE